MTTESTNQPTDLPPEAPLTDSLERIRDRLVAWTLRRRLQAHPAIATLADLYDRRIADDEPTEEQWADARNVLALDLARARDLARDRDLALALALAIALDLDLDRDLALARARARALARDLARARDRDLALALALALDLLSLLGSRLMAMPMLDRQILDSVEAGKWLIDMGCWHGETEEDCGTTHCRAGSAIVIHPMGRELERVFGPHLAGAVIYLRSTGRVPDFFADDDVAMADIRACAAASEVAPC